MLATTSYIVRGLQTVFGTSKRASIERAEEMGRENDRIPLAARSPSESSHPFTTSLSSAEPLPAAPPPAQDPSHVRVFNAADPPDEGSDMINPNTAAVARQDALPTTRARIWAASLSAHGHALTYATGFIIGMPLYFMTGYAMPLHLSTTVLAYLTAVALPVNWKRFMHPVLVSSAFTIVGIWLLSICRHDLLQNGLHAYSTKSGYLQIWKEGKHHPLPGAGDVFVSLLDVSIVALALPMFQYRNELKRHVS